MDRHRAMVWSATLIYAAGLAALVPCAFALSAYGDGGPFAFPFGLGSGTEVAFGVGFMGASFVAGVVSYRHAAILRSMVVRWVGIVAAAVGGTILLCSLWVVVLGFMIAGPSVSALFVPVVAFVVGAAKAGLEGFLLTGLWTALVLRGDRAVSRRWLVGAVHPQGATLLVPVIVFWLCGGVAFYLSLYTIKRLAAGLTRLASGVAAMVM